MRTDREISIDELLAAFEDEGPSRIRCPPHPLKVARDRVESGRVCPADEHEWIDLSGRYWRECRACGLSDVTVADLGQSVATPNAVGPDGRQARQTEDEDAGTDGPSAISGEESDDRGDARAWRNEDGENVLADDFDPERDADRPEWFRRLWDEDPKKSVVQPDGALFAYLVDGRPGEHDD